MRRFRSVRKTGPAVGSLESLPQKRDLSPTHSMKVQATELRKGMVLQKDGDLLVITEYSHSTPGNWRAIIQVRARSLTTGANNSFRPMSNETFETAYLERKKAQYLYQEANGDFVFMEQETYEQFTVPKEQGEGQMVFVKESEVVEVTFHEATPISIALPTTVTLEVTWAELAVKGNTATNVKKEAKVETGLMVKVPLHIKEGERIVINTETGDFVKRSQD